MTAQRAERRRFGDGSLDEAPLEPVRALAHAFAAVAGRGGYRSEDMADAARSLVVLHEAGFDVQKGESGAAPSIMVVLVVAVARARMRLAIADERPVKATPRDEADAERIAFELSQLGFGLGALKKP